jgi:hypothetical protein
MSYEAVRWALYDAPLLLTSAGKPDTAARFVLVARAERADKTGRNTYAGTADLIKATGFDERTIERAERRLERAGLLIRAGFSHLGTVLWHLDMKQKQADGNQSYADAQVERRRKADAVRQQRMRERRKAESIEADVSNKIRVTHSESVTSRTQNPDVTDLKGVTSRTQRPPNHPLKPPVEPPGGTTPGDAPSPDPWRPHSPSAPGTDENNSLTCPLTPAQDQQGDSLPHTRGPAPPRPQLTLVPPIDPRRTA